MNVTKHSSKASLLKELKKQIQLGVTQVAITLVDENETYELVVFGAGTSVGSKEKEQKEEKV